MQYPYIVIPVLTGIFTQIIKFILSILRHRKIEVRYLFTSGHMPSSHASFVISLLTVVGWYKGLDSIEFLITSCLAYIVIYDAMNIRIHIGRNGEAINRMVDELHLEGYPKLKQRVGHYPEEVLVGGLFGFVLAMLLISVRY